MIQPTAWSLDLLGHIVPLELESVACIQIHARYHELQSNALVLPKIRNYYRDEINPIPESHRNLRWPGATKPYTYNAWCHCDLVIEMLVLTIPNLQYQLLVYMYVNSENAHPPI